MSEDAYAVWRATLAGAPMTSMEPQAGFWRTRDGRGGPWIGVAIWPDNDGILRFMRGSGMVEDHQVWPHCGRYPVSEEAYRQWAETGAWPDDAPAIPEREAGIGHNRPETPHEQIMAELAGEKELAAEFLAKPVATQEAADKVAVWAKRLTALSKRADDLRVEAKAPHLALCREIDAEWQPVVTDAKELATKLKGHVTPFLVAQKRAEEERARAAAEEARKLRADAEAQIAAGVADAAEAMQPVVEAEAAAKPRNATAGRTGARVALRTEKRAKIVDYDAALNALREHPEMKALVETLANRAVRAGVPLAGVEVETFQKAA